ncbi:unnamed protein product [Mucor hiemalis]
MSLTRNHTAKSLEQDLKNKLDLISDEILLLEEEIEKETRKVIIAEREVENVHSKAGLLDKLNKQKRDLKELQGKVEQRLELAEKLEADGQDYASELLSKNESKLDEENESLKAEIAAKRELLKKYTTE